MSFLFPKKENTMITPLWFDKELKLIDPMYFAIFHPHIKSGTSSGKARWQIRKWLGVFPKRKDLWDTDMSELIFTICDEQVVDGGLEDVGFVDLNMEAIVAMRESHWWKLDWKRKVEAIDWNNEQLERKANITLEEEGRMAARRIWHANREKDVFLDGQCNRWRI